MEEEEEFVLRVGSWSPIRIGLAEHASSGGRVEAVPNTVPRGTMPIAPLSDRPL